MTSRASAAACQPRSQEVKRFLKFPTEAALIALWLGGPELLHQLPCTYSADYDKRRQLFSAGRRYQNYLPKQFRYLRQSGEGRGQRK